MKKLLFFLLIGTFLINVNAQQYKMTPSIKKKHKVSEPVKVIAIYTSSIILDAVGDGLNDNGNKGWGHFCNAASVGLLLTSPFIIDYDKSKWGWYLTSYVALRIATFDYAYNATRGLPLNYIGRTSTWDKGLKKFNPPNYFGRGVFLTMGIFIPINELGKKKF